MQIGMLGDIIFEVSDDKVLTPSNGASWSGSARYSEHKRHGTHAKTEYTGMDTDKFSMTIIVSAYLGVNPQEIIGKIWTYERNGVTLPLVIGRKAYGKYRWTIKDHKTVQKTYDNEGDLTSCSVAINLIEYLNS